MQVLREQNAVTLWGKPADLVTASEIAYSLSPGSRVAHVGRSSITLACMAGTAPRVEKALASRFGAS
jgi:hypothetical protein